MLTASLRTTTRSGAPLTRALSAGPEIPKFDKPPFPGMGCVINTNGHKQFTGVTQTFNPNPKKNTVYYCRCWQSAKFPYCDGTHKKVNMLMGSNVGPLGVTVAGTNGNLATSPMTSNVSQSSRIGRGLATAFAAAGAGGVGLLVSGAPLPF